MAGASQWAALPTGKGSQRSVVPKKSTKTLNGRRSCNDLRFQTTSGPLRQAAARLPHACVGLGVEHKSCGVGAGCAPARRIARLAPCAARGAGGCRAAGSRISACILCSTAWHAQRPTCSGWLGTHVWGSGRQRDSAASTGIRPGRGACRFGCRRSPERCLAALASA